MFQGHYVWAHDSPSTPMPESLARITWVSFSLWNRAIASARVLAPITRKMLLRYTFMVPCVIPNIRDMLLNDSPSTSNVIT